jgi:hypothetical protein
MAERERNIGEMDRFSEQMKNNTDAAVVNVK